MARAIASATIRAQAQAREREHCARIADEYGDWTFWGQDNNRGAAESAAKEIAAAIRLGRPLTTEEIRLLDKGELQIDKGEGES